MTAPARPAPRRGRPGWDLEGVLRVAVALFIERGYEATSMEDLAQALGIAKSAIYHHVGSKEQLLALAVDRALDGLFAAAEEVASRPAPAVDRLEGLVRASVDVLVDRLPYVTLLLRVRGNTEVERRALDRRRAFDAVVADLVAAAAADGDVRADIDPAVAARLLFGTVNSIVEWYRRGHSEVDQHLGDWVCALAFDGLRVR